MKKLILLACSLIVGYGAIAQSANDAGVTAITSPGISVPASVSQPVTVTIKNYNTSALSAATLGFSVNGVVQPTFAWTGNLAANATSAAVNIGNFTFSPGTHTVKAWTSNPNGTVDANKANDTTTISIRTCTILSGNYTINKNAAASATNFTSINEAAQALANCGISGPVTVSVAPNSGPYNEQVTLGVIPGANATNTVTIEGNGNTITAATVAAKPGVIIFNGADFVKLNNLRINVDPATPAGWGIQLINASDNDIISNCTINVPFSLTGSVHTGIFAGTALATTGNYANNLLVQNNIINGGFNGITIAGTTTTNGNRIINNQIRDSYSSGIYINTGTGTIIEGNDISRPTRTNVGVLYSIYLTGTTTNTVVSKNRIHNTHDVADNTSGQVYGIYNLAVATTGNENIFKNNLFYNINNNGGTLYAFYNSGGNGAFYYHNTVSADNPAVSYTNLRGLHISSSTNVKFINNILSLSSAAPTANKHAIYLASTSGITLVSNYNDLYVGNSGNVGYFGADKAVLADWKAVNSNAYDQNSISTDPVFANPANYLRPVVPALDNGGQPLASVTEDINGVTRNTTTPDMGAYEFTPVTNDAGVSAINTPVSPVIPGSQAVQVTLKNFGTATLTSATIGWSVNNVAQTPYSWTGSLNSLLATAAPVTIGNYTFPTGNLTLKVWSQNPNGVADGLTANDTTILNIVSCSPLAGNYTINKNNPTAGTNFQSIMEAVQKLNSCGVAGPVTITVASGTGPYNEQVEIRNIPFASATNTVTFEGSGNTVSTTPGIRPGIFVLNGAKYVKLNNFVITLPATATRGWGVQLMNAADNNIISNNTVNLPIASTAGDINGIVAGKAIETPGNNTSNTKILNNIINGGSNGIQINGNTGGLNASNNQIVGNQVKDMFAYGIFIIDANGTLVEGNDISRPLRINGAIINGIRLTNACLNTIVSKNRIHNTHDAQVGAPNTFYGIYTASAATVGNENIIKNNLIYNINNANAAFTGFYNAVGSGTYYYHNTVMSDPANTYTTLRGIYFTSAATNVKFINNIIWLPSTATTKHAIYLLNAGIALVSNNNDLYLGSSPNAASGTGYITGATPANKATLADWQAVNSGAYDQNSIATDPLFAGSATGNMKPTAVSMNNLGQPIAAVLDDILGAARNIATPDMGAYEFGVPANDVSITAMAVSNATNCNMSATDSITITIANFGSNIQTSIPVTYSVNGVAIATPETFTGSIAPNATATYTFATKINLSTPSNYQVIAKTMLAGDILTSNDTDTLKVVNTMNPNLPVAIDFETATTGIARMRNVVNSNSTITEDAAATNGTGSKGMIMDGVDPTAWVIPTGTVDPWASNPNNFAATYFCIAPNTCAATDSLIMTFDLKQLFKAANTSTNFRITVDGIQVGPTYRPPFSGTPINWQKVRVDLTPHKNKQTIQIGLESSVKETYDNGNGTANLIDNIEVKCVAVKPQTGVKADKLAAQLNVFPNPSNGIFNVELPKGKTYELVVTDLTGKVLKKQSATGGNNQLNLEGTAKGIYLLNVGGANGIAVRKLIVE